MKLKSIIFAIIITLNIPLIAQIRLEGYQSKEINPDLFRKLWNARWISLPNELKGAYGVYHFRKSFNLESVPDKFVIHVSADNRYKLFINGEQVSLGPARGDILNWNFETVNIAPYLKEGKNVLAALVWNYADLKPLAQISFEQTELIVQGNSPIEEIVNTNGTWLCEKSQAYSPWNSDSPVLGYYVAGPGELFDSQKYLWNWETTDYNDSKWTKANQGMPGSIKGRVDYPGRLLVPTPIPPMENKKEYFASVKKSENIKCSQNFIEGKEQLIIPANLKVELVLDQGYLTTAYMALEYGKGKGAKIKIGYTEAYYTDKWTGEKGNRNEIEGKLFAGYEDKIIADGGLNRTYNSLWWRTWRYIRVIIETKNEELILKNVHGIYSAYPFENKTKFEVTKEYNYLKDILEIGWRTARLCANETYMDCPYYEQLQYFGDTRIQTMVSMYNTSDNYMVKNAIEHGRQSMSPDGITMARYPTNSRQFIPSFSLWWIGISYDYWMYRGDEEYVKSLLPAHRSILAWYEQFLKPNNSLDYIPYWFFIDWADGFAATNGAPIRDEDGNSAMQDVIYLLSLENAAKMEEAFGLPAMANHYKAIANKIRGSFKAKYWDSDRKLFADTFDKRSFSQHVNALAILADLTEREETRSIMNNILNDKDLIQATIYFRYYVNQALKKADMGDQLLDNLQIWKDQMALGLTTWAERPEPSRSDCHAWGASPNIEFYRILLGIDTDAPGFKKIRIKPSLNGIKKISGSMPHPLGEISVDYNIDKKGVLKATIVIPSSINGLFVWKGKEYELKGGLQTLIIK